MCKEYSRVMIYWKNVLSFLMWWLSEVMCGVYVCQGLQNIFKVKELVNVYT